MLGREVYAVSLFCDVVFNVLERADSLTSFSGVLVVVWLSVFCASSSLYRVLVYDMIVVFPDHTHLLLTWWHTSKTSFLVAQSICTLYKG